MDKVIDAIGANLERILRWIYPGALFLVLLRMSDPHIFDVLACRNLGIGLWGLVVGGLVAGFVVYLIQGYVISWFITLFFILIKWDVRQGLQVPVDEFGTMVRTETACCPKCIIRLFNKMAKKKYIKYIIDHYNRMVETDPICCLIWVVPVFDRMAKATRRRWMISGQKDLQNYLNYTWGIYHAVLMTGWLTITFYGINKGESVFSKIPAYEVLTPAILLLVGGLFLYALLTRIRF